MIQVGAMGKKKVRRKEGDVQRCAERGGGGQQLVVGGHGRPGMVRREDDAVGRGGVVWEVRTGIVSTRQLVNLSCGWGWAKKRLG